MSSSSVALAHAEPDMDNISATYAYDASKAANGTLPAVVIRIAQLFDGERSLLDVALAARISETKCRRVVKKLTSLGVLVPQSVQTSSVQRSGAVENIDGFTRLEHDFFNSEVAPIDECDEEVSSFGDRFRENLSEFMSRFRSEKAIG